MNNKRYYKVVSPDLQSCRLNSKFMENDTIKNFTVQYEIDEWVYPRLKHSKLFVFSDLHSALSFIMGIEYQKDQIYECEIKNPTRAYVVISVWTSNLRNKIINVWKLRKNKKRYIDQGHSPPTHTVWCDGVKLIKKVYPV